MKSEPTNPFAPATDEELIVMHHLTTLLNKLSPPIATELFENLLDTDLPVFEEWETEQETSEVNSTQGIIVGLSKEPPIYDIPDVNSTGNGGPIDIYSVTNKTAIGIEGKTKGSLQPSQLQRYQNEINAEKKETISWPDLWRELADLEPKMEPYPQGLSSDFRSYLASDAVDLYQPDRLARRTYHSGEGVKDIKLYADNGEIQIQWYASTKGGRGQNDKHTLEWDRFVKLFENIEERHSKNLIESVFVDLHSFDNYIPNRTQVGKTDPDPSVSAPANKELRLVRSDSGDDINLKLSNRVADDGDIGSPVMGEQWCWSVTPPELIELLTPKPDLPGFDRDLREALFLERNKKAVREELW